MAMNPLECGICNEDFNDRERLPRILLCSHSFCSGCLSQLINAKNKTCPLCRADFEATTTEDLLFNRNVLDIASQFAGQGTSCKQENKAEVTYHYWKKDFIACTEKKLADCRRRKTNMQEAIGSNKTLEDDFLKINNDMKSIITKYLEDQENEGKTLLATLKENSVQMQEQYDSLFKEEEHLMNIVTKLSEVTNFTSASSYMDKAAEIGKTLNEMVEKENQHISLEETSARRILKINSEAKRITGLFQQTLEKKEDDGLYLTTNDLARMSPSMKRNIELGKLLIFQDKEGVRRYAPISLESGTKLCLFHLREDQQLPRDAQLIKHDHVLELLNSRPYRAFLELQNGETVIGRLVIKLDAEGYYPKNFLLMCAGTSGPSFANTNVLEVRKNFRKGECVLIGKDQTDRAAVSGVDWDQELKKGIYYRGISTLKVGLVRGWDVPGISNLSKFFVVTNCDGLTNPLRPYFGDVEEGLDVLTNAISQCADVTQIRVINSGIIFSL